MPTPHECEPDALRIVSALAELHVLARAFSESSTATEFGTTLRVAFVPKTASAWRLIETDCVTSGLRRVRMLCFGSFEEIKRAIQERVDWAAADQLFRATQMATPAGFPGVTADWVHSKDFDLIFGPARFALRAKICATSSARTLVLR